MQHVAENGFDTSKFTKFLKVYYCNFNFYKLL